MTENKKKIEKNTDDPNPKSPYKPPQMVIYGDIQDITLASERGEARDNPAPGSNFNMTGFSNPTPKPNPSPTQG